jgi:hypothetical protein
MGHCNSAHIFYPFNVKESELAFLYAFIMRLEICYRSYHKLAREGGDKRSASPSDRFCRIHETQSRIFSQDSLEKLSCFRIGREPRARGVFEGYGEWQALPKTIKMASRKWVMIEKGTRTNEYG